MTSSDDLSAALLARLPLPAELPALRAEALAAMARERARVKLQRILVQSFWIFCAAASTAYMWFGPAQDRVPRAPVLACFFLLWGGIEVIKHRIYSSRVEVLAEIKQLQLQVAELAQHISHPR